MKRIIKTFFCAIVHKNVSYDIKNVFFLGVLTGVGTEADLTHADLIVDDVTQVVELITPSQDNKAREWHSVQVGFTFV